MTDFNDVHEAFAVSRSEDYVYCPGDESYFSKLDQHAETIEGDAKLPFVILGSPGCGKSALLANWVQRRKKTKHRDEFLFQHFVGCSPKSKQLSHLLFRLESALNDELKLRMEVPKSEERLRWSLSRFLSSAAKKHVPARIVIVLDGVNKLLGEVAADTMHWLPTELQPGVRFILSTSEFDKYSNNGAEPPEGSRLHRTWTELKRRRCPFLRMKPLEMDVRHSIIESFIDKFHDSVAVPQTGDETTGGEVSKLEINSAQRFRIATANASSQPMFLRTILYALRLGVEMSPVSIDEQIDLYLSAGSPSDLISKIFDLCSEYVEGGRERKGILSRVLSVLYASRHGLSDEEIWGSVEMAMGAEIPDDAKVCIQRILKDLTMCVGGLRMFSHEDYQRAVYMEYIRTPDLNIRLHLLMARYFGRLEPCDRKLDSLPYHLEVSGSWSKLKGALVSVEMFRLWWTPKHKNEFMSLWASLTNCDNPKLPIRKLVTGEFDNTMRCNQPSRPCYDIVEEYVRSCDEYKFVHDPSPEELSEVILKVADFMLELATLSIEEQADVPQFIHPAIPNEDLESLGVPYLDTDDEGRSVLRTPIFEFKGTGKSAVEPPAATNEEIPVCSTYFYHRWMWIQFPWVALSNCGANYQKGIDYNQSQKKGYAGSKLGKMDSNKITVKSLNKPSVATLSFNGGRPMPEEKLPRLKPKVFSKRAHTTPLTRPKDDTGVNEDMVEKQWEEKVVGLRAEISDHRHELDQFKQQRTAMERQITKLKDELGDMQKMHFGSAMLEEKRDKILARIDQTEQNTRNGQELHKNYMSVYLMCQRHPAHAQALIDELEAKLSLDTGFIEQCRASLRAKEFEAHMSRAAREEMQKAIEETNLLQHDLTTHRHRQLENLRKVSEQELARPTKEMVLSEIHQENKSKQARGRKKANDRKALQGPDSQAQMQLIGKWEEWQAVIQQRTGINEPEQFFKKFETQEDLEQQMMAMRSSSDVRHRELLQETDRVLHELEEARYEAQAAGMNFGEVRKKQETLSKNDFTRKHKKESAEAMERLSQAALSGLKHVCETLGMPPMDPDTQISDLINSVDSLLDTLLEEKDRAQQKTAIEGIPRREPHKVEKSHRASELNAALVHYETPKQRVANRLHGRISEAAEAAEAAEKGPEDVEVEFDVSQRASVKGLAVKSLKEEKRRLARVNAKKELPQD